MKKNNKPLTPKQRERLAREARQRNAAKAAATAPVKVKTPVARETKWFAALVAVILVFATLASVLFGFLIVRWTEDPYRSVYETVRMKDYFNTSAMGKDYYTGVDYDMSAYYKGELTDEEFDARIEELLLANRKEIALMQKDTVIGYGDDVAYYVIGVKDKDGKAVLTGDFAADSYASSTLTVGKEAFGEGFDAALVALGLKPSDTYLKKTLTGTLTGDEVVIITLTAVGGTKKDGATGEDASSYTWDSGANAEVKSLTSARLDLSAEDEALRNALAGKAIGEDVTFLLYDHVFLNGKRDAVKYEVRVEAVVEEQAKDITFTVPEGYFSENDAEDLYLLNGTNLTFSVIIPYVNDYEIPALDAAFVTETMEFETEETDVVAAFKEAKRTEWNESAAESFRSQCVMQIFNSLATKAKFVKDGIADEMWYDQYYALLEEYRAAVGSMPTSESELNSFVSYRYGASAYNDVIVGNAKQMLVMYYVFAHARIRITDEMLEKAYDEYVDSLMASVSDTMSEEQIALLYTEEELYRQARKNLVYDLVSDYLLEHNNIITESKK